MTQARLLRELERAESQHTAARARILAVFDGQWGFRDDGHGGPHPWLTWQTRVTGKAASGAIGWMRRLPGPSRGRGRLGPPDVFASCTARSATGPVTCRWSCGMRGRRSWWTRRRAARIWMTCRGWRRTCSPGARRPTGDSDREQARFRDRFFRLTRLFQGHGRADGDLTPECLAAVTEVLDTLGKKGGPEDNRTAGQRGHDALEEAMRLLLASGCLPERAGQEQAQVQLHLGLDELLSMPGAAQAAPCLAGRPPRHPGRPPPLTRPPVTPPPVSPVSLTSPAASLAAVTRPAGDPSAGERGVADQG